MVPPNQLMKASELSISQWHLCVLCDGYIPNASKLIDDDPKSTPRCSRYLFQAYHYVNNKDDCLVHIVKWICFQSRRLQDYEKPPLRKKEKKKTRLTNTHNPTSKILEFKGWTKPTRAPFTKLGIPPKNEEETHLATHLSCQQGVLVLLGKTPRLIRLESFRMVSMMVKRKEVESWDPCAHEHL